MDNKQKCIAIIALMLAMVAIFLSSEAGINGINGTNGTSFVSGTLTFVLHNDSSDVTAYSSLKMDSVVVADVNKTQREFYNIQNGDTLIANWTSLPINLTLIPSGAIRVHIHGAKFYSTAHVDTFWYSVGIVNSTGGNYSSVGISPHSTIIPNGNTETEFDIDGAMSEKIVNYSDRMALFLYVNETGVGAAPDIRIYMDDLTLSRLIIPAIPIDLTSLINNVASNSANISNTNASIQSSLNLKVNKSGDTMTGTLNTAIVNNSVYGITMQNLHSPSRSYVASVSVPDGTRPLHFNLTVSNSTSANTANTVYCNGHCNINFTDISFSLDNSTDLPYWIENTTTGVVWINVTSSGIVNMKYGNSSITTSGGNIFTTFNVSDDFNTDLSRWSTSGSVSIVNGKMQIIGSSSWGANSARTTASMAYPLIMEVTQMNSSITNSEALVGIGQSLTYGTGHGRFAYKSLSTSKEYFYSDLFGSSGAGTSQDLNVNRYKVVGINSTYSAGYKNGVLLGTITTSDTGTSAQGLLVHVYSGTSRYDNMFMHEYPENTFPVWGAETTTIPTTSTWCLKVNNLGELYTTSGAC